MRRLQLIELHDLPRFPAVWRDLLTDFIGWYATVFRPYRLVVQVLSEALRSAGTTRIVDLCAGGGGPLLALKPSLDRALGAQVTVTLTDKYPNLDAFKAAAARSPSSVDFVPEPVDATAVCETATGFRTLFASFHHFPPEQARAILADAVQRRQGIGVFEFTERRLLVWAVPLLLMPAVVWCVTPWIRPLTWCRLLWTYVVPVVPLVAAFDGLVSVLRSYSVDEFRALAHGLDGNGYGWQIGSVRSFGASRVTYAIGVPAT
jgi:hypothetical protein